MLNSSSPVQAASPAPTPLARGQNGIVVGTTGSMAVHAGLQILKKGGSAADAAMATALAQVVECGGAYVSCAGILRLLYFNAASGTISALNAGFNTPLAETDALSIPVSGVPSGRSALVPGFMAGVQAALDRFGKLPRAAVFQPAIAMAEGGFTVTPFLAGAIALRREVLSRLPDTRRIFIRKDGTLLRQGDLFRQRQLASVLREVATQGAGVMYTGRWARRFVSAIQREGGRITLEDMATYSALWELPLETHYQEYVVSGPGLSSNGGVDIIEALHLLERADSRRRGYYCRSPDGLFWLMQISACSALGSLPPGTIRDGLGRDLTPGVRLSNEAADWIWSKMKEGTWPLAARLARSPTTAPTHSDGIVAVDRWGNVAAVTHSINTTLWGTTGLFVDGVSIPDSAAIQKTAVFQAGPGRRLPDPMCPLIVRRDGRTVLACSAIGGGLHEKTLQVLSSILDFGIDAQSAVEAPAFLLPDFQHGRPVARVETASFDRGLLQATSALGQKITTVDTAKAPSYRGYWIGVQFFAGTEGLLGAGSRQLPSFAEGY